MFFVWQGNIIGISTISKRQFILKFSSAASIGLSASSYSRGLFLLLLWRVVLNSHFIFTCTFCTFDQTIWNPDSLYSSKYSSPVNVYRLSQWCMWGRVVRCMCTDVHNDPAVFIFRVQNLLSLHWRKLVPSNRRLISVRLYAVGFDTTVSFRVTAMRL
jgi:hypothetical protein